MKTKILFFLFFFFLVSTNVSAQNASTDSLLQEIKQARNLLENWDKNPGTENDKLLAFITKKPIQISDSIRKKEDRYLGFLIARIYHYRRYIEYDKTNKVFKDRLELSEKNNNIYANIFMTFINILLIVCFVYLTKLLYRNPIHVAWIIWIMCIGLLILFSYSLGSLLVIGSLSYIFKDEIREWIKNFLQKRKEKREQKKKKKQKKD